MLFRKAAEARPQESAPAQTRQRAALFHLPSGRSAGTYLWLQPQSSAGLCHRQQLGYGVRGRRLGKGWRKWRHREPGFASSAAVGRACCPSTRAVVQPEMYRERKQPRELFPNIPYLSVFPTILLFVVAFHQFV